MLERLFKKNRSMKKAVLYYGSTASPTIDGVRAVSWWQCEVSALLGASTASYLVCLRGRLGGHPTLCWLPELSGF